MILTVNNDYLRTNYALSLVEETLCSVRGRNWFVTWWLAADLKSQQVKWKDFRSLEISMCLSFYKMSNFAL